MRPSRAIHLEDIIEALREYRPDAETNDILAAYAFASSSHGGQTRLSGQPYMSHPMEVAMLLTRLKMEPSVLAAALLHDTIEDTKATAEELKSMFGHEIAQMVEGLTKLAKIKFVTKEQRQAENVRKMILALAEDIRIVVIKLADRLHNMQTLEYLTPDRQRAIASETLDIYAPIADRLGLSWMKAELEDHAFKYVYPTEYHDMKKLLDEKEEEVEEIVKSIGNTTKELLLKEKIPSDVVGRRKNLYSIFRKMEEQHLEFNQIHDIIGIRIITSSNMDCYRALGAVHSRWKPVPGKLKDYIALPKDNMYQSIHSTVITPSAMQVEFQIRTQQMHIASENGIAAHWRYREGNISKEASDDGLFWVRRLVEMGRSLDSSEEFLDSLKTDLFPDEVYVFTPKLEVFAFPKGATVIDFAYAVHTQVGERCAGAFVNNISVGIEHELKNGDTVKVETYPSQQPSREWLNAAVTSHARSNILSYIRGKEKTDAIELGRDIVEAELLKHKFSPKKYLTNEALKEAAAALGFKTSDLLLQRVGFSKVSIYGLLQKLLPAKEWKQIAKVRRGLIKKFIPKMLWKKSKEISGVRVGSSDNMLVRFAQCCHPVPGDKILGFVSSGQGLVIHNSSCPSLRKQEPDTEKLVKVQWETEGDKRLHPVQIIVYSLNQPGILANVSTAIANCKANISNAVVSPTDRLNGELNLTVEIEDLQHLQQVLDAVKKVKGVKSAKRKMKGELAG